MALAALTMPGCDAGYALPRTSSYGAAYGYGPSAPTALAKGSSPPAALTVVAEAPLAVGSALAAVPLVLVPSSQLRVLQDGNAASPVIKLRSAEHEAMPAVRVVLARPMVVSSPQSTIPFPAAFTVLHHGVRTPIPVGAVLAPVAAPPATLSLLSSAHPFAVRVVYAVPSGPLPFNLPFHAQYPQYQFSHPLFFNPGPVSGTAVAAYPVRPAAPRPPPSRPTSPSTPAPPQEPSLPSRPQQQLPPRPPLVSSGRPVVTVLDFPNVVASPPVLVVQGPIYGEEDESLNAPPQAVVPAGIVQSTQPRPVQSVFTNSKDNEFLQQMRDQAALNAQTTVEAAGGGSDLSVEDYEKIYQVLYN